MLIISACWFNFKTRKRRCKSCRVFNVQNEVYTCRVLGKVGCVVCQKFLGRFSLSRRDVDLPRRDVKITLLCHVATWIYTSRRQLVHGSVTSRRVFSCRDVKLYQPLSRRDVDSNVATSPNEALCHVATWPRTSRRDPIFSPRMVHFGPSPHTSSLIGTLAPLHPNPHRTCRSSHPTGRRPSTAHRPPVFFFESPSSAGFGS